MTMLSRLLAFLQDAGVPHTHSIHRSAPTAMEVASAENMPAHNLAKTVIYFGSRGYGMLVLAADCSADLHEVRRLLDLSDIRLATESELAALFPECEVGAMPPFGNLFNMPLLMDESLATADYIAFSAGTHRDAIHMSVADFHALVNPLVAPFARDSGGVRAIGTTR